MMNTGPDPLTAKDFGAVPDGITDCTDSLQRFFRFTSEMAAVDLEMREGKIRFHRRGEQEASAK